MLLERGYRQLEALIVRLIRGRQILFYFRGREVPQPVDYIRHFGLFLVLLGVVCVVRQLLPRCGVIDEVVGFAVSQRHTPPGGPAIWRTVVVPLIALPVSNAAVAL